MKKSATFIAAAALLATVSCDKRDDPPPAPPKAELVLNLGSSVLKPAEVDSADVVFRKTGTGTSIRARFEKTTQHLVASIGSLSPGTWNADIEVYTKTINQASNQYVIITPVQVGAGNVGIAGPGATPSNGWVKRHVKASAGNEIVVIVPDNPYDAWFEFRTRAPKPYIFGIQREAINVNYVVSQKSWVCNTNCLDAANRITNLTHFLPFTQTVQASPWTENRISIAVLNDKSETLLEYERTWNQ